MFLRSLLSTCCLWQKVMALKLNFSSTSVFYVGYIPLPGVHFWSIKHLPLFLKWCFPHVQCWLGGNSCKAGKNNYRDFCLSPFLSSRRGGGGSSTISSPKIWGMCVQGHDSNFSHVLSTNHSPFLWLVSNALECHVSYFNYHPFVQTPNSDRACSLNNVCFSWYSIFAHRVFIKKAKTACKSYDPITTTHFIC